MDPIKKGHTGAAVEDVQNRLVIIGLMTSDQVDGVFGDETERAVRAFRKQRNLPDSDEIDNQAWSLLVDASFQLGDRTLYLRMPYFHGHDVRQLQQVLQALGFACGAADGIFGAFTEGAVRVFQLNCGLPSDGIVGAYTYSAIRHLQHSWEGKEGVQELKSLGFARAADVLEQNALCLFGTQDFTRSVASRMSNLALATNPASKITSADSLLVAPDSNMLLVRIVLPSEAASGMPRVVLDEEGMLHLRLRAAINTVRGKRPCRIAIELPGTVWESAGEDRSAQHYAIALLDALCLALS